MACFYSRKISLSEPNKWDSRPMMFAYQLMCGIGLFPNQGDEDFFSVTSDKKNQRKPSTTTLSLRNSLVPAI